MSYNEAEARALVIEAGHRLLENKLISRTWGNISARISEDSFVITPSGRAYDTLKPEELVEVKISDLSYGGDIKPSSEKGIHAAAYALRPDADFVIHTHQFYASAVCADGKDTDFAPCAAYGLPGTGKLKDNVAESIKSNPDKKMFLMARHGAVCLGESFEDAFALAEELEEKSKALYEKRAEENKSAGDKKPWLDDYAQIVGLGKKDAPDEDKDAVELISEKNAAAALYVRDAKPIGFFDLLLQRAVYLLKYSKQKNK